MTDESQDSLQETATHNPLESSDEAGTLAPTPGSRARTSEELAAFATLLAYLKQNRGLDLTGYKAVSLMRRVDKHMLARGVADYAAFVDYLEVHQDEFKELFNEILINVTTFFRDPDAWSELARQVIKPLIERRGRADPLRIWSAGCSSGEEAYSLAILLAEAMGEAAFKSRVKIYATDADDKALAQARQGTYDERQLREVSADLLDRYFERGRDGRYTFRSDLRRALIFGRHDLMQDAPISRIDVLVCRNVLIYFNAEMQSRILARFAVALNEGGVLFLGRAETLLSRTTLFTPLDLKRRFFARLNTPTLRERLFVVPGEAARLAAQIPGETITNFVLDAAFDTSPVAQMVLDAEGTVALINERARHLFRLGPSDIGRPLQDLELSYRPLELRSRVEELLRTGRNISVPGVALALPNGITGSCDVQFAALGGREQPLGIAITFVDTTDATRLQREVEHANQELETAYEELQSTNEELETTNEELQSTVEELETTNEELQSTNEELETMNEELQSTNEELMSMNDAMRGRGQELEATRAFVDGLIASLPDAVVVLDRAMRVLAWNSKSFDLWGLRGEETMGKDFFSFEIGLPLDALVEPIRRALTGDVPDRPFTVRATNRRGKTMRCDIRCLPFMGPAGTTDGVTLIMETVALDD